MTLGWKFLERTASQIPTLRDQIAHLAATADRETLQDVQHLAHEIHGTGATFGFDHISELGKALEVLVMRLTAHTDTATDRTGVLAQMRKQLDWLSEAVAAAP